MTYAEMSAATTNPAQFRRSTIINSLVSKEIHDQSESEYFVLKQTGLIACRRLNTNLKFISNTGNQVSNYRIKRFQTYLTKRNSRKSNKPSKFHFLC